MDLWNDVEIVVVNLGWCLCVSHITDAMKLFHASYEPRAQMTEVYSSRLLTKIGTLIDSWYAPDVWQECTMYSACDFSLATGDPKHNEEMSYDSAQTF